VTVDSGIGHEQNLDSLPLAVVAMQALTNTLDDLRPLAPAVLGALEDLRPRTLVRVP